MSSPANSSFTNIICGTGSTFPIENARQWQPYLKHRCTFIHDGFSSPVANHDFRSAKEHLENIRKTLKPNMSDLAAIFEISRQALYKWLAEESNPEDDKLELLRTLSQIADSFANSGIKKADYLFYMKNSEGISLFDLLKNGLPHDSHVNLLIAEAKAMQFTYQNSGIAQSKSIPTSEWTTYLSLPAYPEE